MENQQIGFDYIGGKYPHKLQENIKVCLSDGKTVVIPKGLKTDGRSVPWLFQCFMSRYPKNIVPYLFHDAAYILDWRIDELGVINARRWADSELLYLALKSSKTRKETIEAYVSYYFVRIFGKSIYKKRL